MPETLLLMYGVLPLWLLAGLLDWALHRRASIETTAGLRESHLHLLMLAQLGLPAVLVLLCEVNAGVLALCAVAWLAHEVTVYVDLRWSVARRPVTPLEQMVHSVQEILPLLALALLVSLHWPQAAALGGWGDTPARYSLQLKEPPLPPAFLWSVGAGIAVLLLCYLEEWYRCLRARSRPLA